MLRKLFIYDLKNQLRLWKFLYLGFFILSGLNAVLSLMDVQRGFWGEIWGGVCEVSKEFVLVAGFIMVLASALYPILYFRKNLLRDEGYLMHTLPVKESSLFFSKFFSSWCFVLFSILVFLMGYFIMKLGAGEPMLSLFTDNGEKITLPMLFFSEECQIYRGILVIIFFVIPINLILFMFSLVMGYTMKQGKKKMNKDLLSVLVYIGTYAGEQFVGVFSIIISAWIYFSNQNTKRLMIELLNTGGDISLPMEDVIYNFIVVYLAFMIGLSLAAIMITIRRLNRNLNLE